jgi:hypothetical protein
MSQPNESDVVPVAIVVHPVNDGPSATPQSVQLNEDGAGDYTWGTDIETGVANRTYVASVPSHGRCPAQDETHPYTGCPQRTDSFTLP